VNHVNAVSLTMVIILFVVVTGVGFAGPTNFAMLCDFTVMVRGGSTIGMTGPALVKAGIGEIATAEDLGGAAMQADRNGAADLAVDSVEEAVSAIRLYLSYFPSNASMPPPVAPCDDPIDRPAPELRGLVPVNLSAPYDMLDVIEAVADLGSVFELKPTHAGNLITALARVGGRPVGVIANQPAVRGGVLDAAASDKGARFISLCDAFGLALVYLIDIPGFLIGTEAEVAERVGRFAAAGVDRLIVSPAHLERDQQLHTLERLAAMAGVNSPE